MRRSSRHQKEPDPETLEQDAEDEFANEREKVMLNKAGWDHHNKSNERDSDEEVSVMNISSSEDESSDSEKDIEQIRKKLQGPVDSDEEQYFVDQGGDERYQEEASKVGENDGEDDDDRWGTEKREYYGGEDLEDEEEEENSEDESKAMEKEGLRLQKKHLEALNMDDYMLDEAVDEWKAEKSKEEEKEIQKREMKHEDVSKLDKQARYKLLSRRYPEFIPLTKEFESLKPVLAELKEKHENEAGNDIVKIKFATLSAYLGTVASYFAIFMTKMAEGDDFSMKDESIMNSILTSRQVWYQAKELPEDVEDIEDDDDDEDVYEDVSENLNDNADEDVDEDEDSEEVKANDDNEVSDNDDEFTLHTHEIHHLKHRQLEDIDSVDAEEKKGRRKTLGFYTSKIDQREKKKFTKFQGDEDIPYKERLFERQQRLLEAARKRGDRNNKNAPGADLDDSDFNEEDEADAKAIGGNDYYEKIKSNKISKKNARRRAHQMAVKAAKEGKLAELQEDVGENGKRAINYQILKNRGLTKRRRKDDRNSRVKRRRKYAQAQKKLKSVRAVYRTPKGPYGGEESGIKKNISRSVKLV